MDVMEEVLQLRKEAPQLREALAAALAEIARLQARVAELEAQARQNSSNSSKPPSSDLGGRKRKPPVDPSKRKRGGQPGHEGKARELVPIAQVDEVVDRDPETCANCGGSLQDAPRMDAMIRQVVETPEFKSFVREYHLWRKRCLKCGGFTRGQMPPGSPKGTFGPRIQARVALLSGRYRLTRREVRAITKDLFNVEVSLGSVQACCEAVSAAIEPAAGAIHAEVKAAPVVHADETGFGRCGDDRMWLWAASSPDAEAFRLLPGRGAAQAKDLLGEGFSGVLHRDRWKPYEQLSGATHQLCWAHLRRDIQAMVETMGETGVQGAMLKLASDRAFALWHAFQDGTIGRGELIRDTKPIQDEMRQRLRAIRDGCERDFTKKARGTAKDVLRLWDSLWTYLEHEGVVPTNNEAERTIRKAVLWRKGSFGAGSENGCRFAERILTITGTARRRRVDILAWLTRALQARLEGRPAPALQPT